jgi:hypothetical protein
MRLFSTITPFFLAVQKHIVEAGLVPDTCCQLALTERYLEYPQGRSIIQIIPETISSRGYDDGGGLMATVIDGYLTFKLVNLNILDVATSDVIALHDNNIFNINTGNAQGTTIGLYPQLDSLIEVLQMFDGCYTDVDGIKQSYLIEPMRFVNAGIPTRDSKHDQYVYLDVKFSYAICQNIL